MRHLDTIMALCGKRERLDLVQRLAEARHVAGDVAFEVATADWILGNSTE